MQVWAGVCSNAFDGSKGCGEKIHRRANVVAESHQSWDGAMLEVVPGGMTQLEQMLLPCSCGDAELDHFNNSSSALQTPKTIHSRQLIHSDVKVSYPRTASQKSHKVSLHCLELFDMSMLVWGPDSSSGRASVLNLRAAAP
ncbi:hypothetical protein J6590_107530, partial [Homalodisca vitripennis]